MIETVILNIIKIVIEIVNYFNQNISSDLLAIFGIISTIIISFVIFVLTSIDHNYKYSNRIVILEISHTKYLYI